MPSLGRERFRFSCLHLWLSRSAPPGRGSRMKVPAQAASHAEDDGGLPDFQRTHSGPVRRSQRKRLLYGLHREMLPHVSLPDAAGDPEQGHVHLFAGPGQGLRLHCRLHDTGNSFRASLPILLPIFFGLDGLLWSFPAADLLTFLIAIFFIRQTYRELKK